VLAVAAENQHAGNAAISEHASSLLDRFVLMLQIVDEVAVQLSRYGTGAGNATFFVNASSFYLRGIIFVSTSTVIRG
jgi:hypothetical protein